MLLVYGRLDTLMSQCVTSVRQAWHINLFVVSPFTPVTAAVVLLSECMHVWNIFTYIYDEKTALFCPLRSSVLPQSHQTRSYYVLQNGLRTGCCENILDKFKVLDVLAHSGSLYYVQVVCITFR